MLKLNLKNYYTTENTAISNSKVSDFLKSKEYYKAKHIDHSIEFVPSSSMKIGSMVDEALTVGSLSAIKKSFYVKVPYERGIIHHPNFVVSQIEFDKAYAIAKKVLKSDLYKWYKENGAMTQVILQGNYDGVDVCGIADCVTVVGDTVYLDDWKTAKRSSLQTPRHWLRHCQDLGYLRQLAHYKNMLLKTFADKEIICRHIVMSNDSEYPEFKIYRFINEDLESYLEEFKDTVYAISKEKKWKDDFPDHTKPIIIKIDD